MEDVKCKIHEQRECPVKRRIQNIPLCIYMSEAISELT